MYRRLPSLSALRTFEAAARHESFKHAAEELAVTPVAVTRQVKSLETAIGLPLFSRHHRRVALTEAGRELAGDLAAAFGAISGAVERTRRRAGIRVLRIGTDRIFGERWLAPRLAEFGRRHPGIEVELAPGDDGEAWLDGVIYYGTGLKVGPRRHILFRDTVFPVCSPALVRGRSTLRGPADLARHRLLHEGSVDWWQRWLAAAGAVDVESTSGAIYMSPGRAYDSAVAGEGVVIGNDILTAAELLDGRLVRPFEPFFDGGTYALARHGPDDDQAMATFVRWLVVTCREHKAGMRERLGLKRGRAIATATARPGKCA